MHIYIFIYTHTHIYGSKRYKHTSPASGVKPHLTPAAPARSSNEHSVPGIKVEGTSRYFPAGSADTSRRQKPGR